MGGHGECTCDDVRIQDMSQSGGAPWALSSWTTQRSGGIGTNHVGGDDGGKMHHRRPDIFTSKMEHGPEPKEALCRFRWRRQVHFENSTGSLADLYREETRLQLEVERLRNQRNLLVQDVSDLEAKLRAAEDELLQVRGAVEDARSGDGPVLYAIAPVGVPTPVQPEAAAQEKISIVLQHRVAGAHGNMVDVLA